MVKQDPVLFLHRIWLWTERKPEAEEKRNDSDTEEDHSPAPVITYEKAKYMKVDTKDINRRAMLRDIGWFSPTDWDEKASSERLSRMGMLRLFVSVKGVGWMLDMRNPEMVPLVVKAHAFIGSLVEVNGSKGCITCGEAEKNSQRRIMLIDDNTATLCRYDVVQGALNGTKGWLADGIIRKKGAFQWMAACHNCTGKDRSSNNYVTSVRKGIVYMKNGNKVPYRD